MVKSGNALFKVVYLKATNGIFIEFALAVSLLIEGLFVCLPSACGYQQEPRG